MEEVEERAHDIPGGHNPLFYKCWSILWLCLFPITIDLF